ncbi:MAG: DUF3842 family protein [Clostridiales bacterium]|jgi:hypothetical protein|nr:DUF3842 family protein [Clostridiales bacterium]
MKILIIDAQGGGIGRQLVSAIKERFPNDTITAVGTNSAATAAMIKAGADNAATGENAVKVCSGKTDVIIGPLGIVIADSMHGEITPSMAIAIGQSSAKRILIPVSHCDNIIVGISDIPLAKMIENVSEELSAIRSEDK